KEGFFGPCSLHWKYGRENILSLGGPAAILLQLAHPKVAAGVDDHSDFYHDPMGRLERTFKIIHRVIFGDVQEALEAALKVRIVHESVQGHLPENVGPYERKDSYHANQPNLLLWVHATLIDQTLRGYERFVKPLNWSDKQQYYRESKRFAKLFGIPGSEIPDTFSDFQSYYQNMLKNRITVSQQALELKEQLFSRVHFTKPATVFFASSMLPEPLRKAFNLPWNPVMSGLDRLISPAIRRVTHSLPPELRYVKKYRYRMIELGQDERMQSLLSTVLQPFASHVDAIRQFV
ncbi:MAG: oxygenase MpaB family protein, partial [bacterium]